MTQLKAGSDSESAHEVDLKAELIEKRVAIETLEKNLTAKEVNMKLEV